jgi:glycosyltransferase involved in cell wall biosynthesis
VIGARSEIIRMIKDDVVSIIMPSYNHAKYVREAMESIFNQTYPYIEFIFINDCSPDDTERILMDMLPRWNVRKPIPIKYHRNEYNMGVVKSLNIGLEMSTGKYISVLASDDVMSPHKTQLQHELLEGLMEDVGMVYSDLDYITEDGKNAGRASKHSNFKNGNVFEDIFYHRTWVPVTAAMIRKDVFRAIGNFDERYHTEDLDITLRIANAYGIRYISEPLVKKRLRIDSLGSFNDTMCGDILNILEKAYLSSGRKGLSIKKAKSCRMISFSHWYADTSKIKEAVYWQWRALLADPCNVSKHIRNVLRLLAIMIFGRNRHKLQRMMQRMMVRFDVYD